MGQTDRRTDKQTDRQTDRGIVPNQNLSSLIEMQTHAAGSAFDNHMTLTFNLLTSGSMQCTATATGGVQPRRTESLRSHSVRVK